MKNWKRYRILGLAALVAVSMIAGTWAYYSQALTIENEFHAGKYATELAVTLDSPTKWQPGQEVNKDVRVQNTGTVPVFARVKLNQKWIRKADVYDANGNLRLPRQGDAFDNTFPGENGPVYAAVIKWGDQVVLLASGKAAAGEAELGLPTVESAEEASGKWLLISETPDDNGDYTFYYMGVVKGGSETPLLLDAVEMNPEIQAITLAEHITWDETEQKWVKTVETNPVQDYQNARFELTATMNTVQATSAALYDMFDSDRNDELAVISYLSSTAVTGRDTDQSRDDQVSEKKLSLIRKGGELTYTPSSPDGNWFMSHLNMLPGESYEDELIIDNQTGKVYRLFLQVVPRDGQEELPRQLLEKISMKVYHNDKLIYNGTALGRDYTDSLSNLQNAVKLGRYSAKDAGKIRVELLLDKDIPQEYADMLTQIDWKFTAERQPNLTEDGIDSVEAPKTGDIGVTAYAVFMTVSGVLLVTLLAYERRCRKERRK